MLSLQMEDHSHHSMENDDEPVEIVLNFAVQIELDLTGLVEVALNFAVQIELDLTGLVEVVLNFAVPIEPDLTGLV